MKQQKVRAGPAQPAQPDGMHQIYFSETNDMPDILFQTYATSESFYSNKYTEHEIVRAGPAQPAQLDGMQQTSFSKPNEIIDICSVRGSM